MALFQEQAPNNFMLHDCQLWKDQMVHEKQPSCTGGQSLRLLILPDKVPKKVSKEIDLIGKALFSPDRIYTKFSAP